MSGWAKWFDSISLHMPIHNYMSQPMQIFVKSNEFDVVSYIKSAFAGENENYGPIIKYTHDTHRSYVDDEGIEWFGLMEDWDSLERPNAVEYRYRLHVDVKRAWQKFVCTASGIEFVFESKEKAEENLNKLKKGIDKFH